MWIDCTCGTPMTHQEVEALWRSGEEEKAIRGAVKIRDPSGRLTVVRQAWAARLAPDFYLQIGHDPAALWERAVSTMAELYGRAANTEAVR